MAGTLTATDGASGDGLATARVAGPWRDKLRMLLRQRSAVIGLIIISILSFAALFADVIAPHPPNKALNGPGEPGRRAQPCVHLLGCPADQPQTLLGTDGNSRDLFSRTLHGARVSLVVGFATAGLAVLIGSTIGAIAGFAAGGLDNGLMRVMDVMLAFPALVLAIAIASTLGRGLLQSLIAVAIVSIPIYARVMRASVLSVRGLDYVTASRALGETNRGLLVRRVLPNALTPMIVVGTLGIGTAVLETAALSFLGLGMQPPDAEWGAMIASEFNGILTRPLIVLVPGFALTLLVVGFNLLGDGLRDTLDPRLDR
ncbi:MAG: ABC transporter permease [Chloroflexi bacterium]|nr:ABC transporter permease [Chloroflexota bacterium]